MTFLNVAVFLSVFLPLISSIYTIIIGRFVLGKVVAIHATAFLFLAAFFGWYVGVNFYIKNVAEIQIHLWQWIDIGFLTVNFALRFDMLTVVMVIMITTISALVHLYSIGYMKKDKTLDKFMSYMGLFTFFMLFLVASPNLIQLFFGWEGVGFCSYLLIGYWYHKEKANNAAMKAFVVNRIGDLGFLLGIAACFYLFESIDFKVIIETIPLVSEKNIVVLHMSVHTLMLVALLLFFAAMGKSAQFGLHTWLPDAMEGPTPASALIHAATMVTAGVFLLVRLSPLYEAASFSLEIIAIIGLITAIFAGTVAVVQNDIKRVIAYSTCSQLGFMFFSIGVKAYAIAIFHLVTHACFKALLFLGAGSIIQAMSDEHNMKKMGGLFKYIPKTYAVMWIGTLALIGIPFFSGYYSKDAIMEIVLVYGGTLGKIIYYGALFSIFLTALYAMRVMMLVFHGKIKAHEKIIAHIKESPMVMLVPLFILAIGSIFVGGILSVEFVNDSQNFWGRSIVLTSQLKLIEKVPHIPYIYLIPPVVLGFLGIIVGWLLFEEKFIWRDVFKKKLYKIHLFFFEKWYIDEFYELFICRPYQKIAMILWKKGEDTIIEGIGPKGISYIILKAGRLLSRLQTGYLCHYILGAVIGIVGILWIFLI